MIKIKQAADNKKIGMTLAELRTFTAEAVGLDLPDSTVIKATIGFNGQVQKLETK